MTLLLIYILLIILNFLFPKSKALFVADFFVMWLLMGWNTSTADYNIYVTRYLHPEIYGTMEPLYVFFEDLGKGAGLDYDTFLIVMSFIFLTIRMIATLILSKKHNVVVALYLLFPFVMDVCQLRMFYATSVVLIGTVFLLKNSKKGDIAFLISVGIATFIHSACILYILVLVAKHFNRDKIKEYGKYVVLIVIVLYALLLSGGLYTMLKSITGLLGFGKKFVETVYATSLSYKITNKIVYMLEIFLFFILMNFIMKKQMKGYETNKDKNYEFLKLCYKTNYSFLFVLPLAWFSGDIYRVQHGILILFYSAIANAPILKIRLPYHGFKITYHGLRVLVFTAAFIFLFLLGIQSLREAVFIPAFFNNALIG